MLRSKARSVMIHESEKVQDNDVGGSIADKVVSHLDGYRTSPPFCTVSDILRTRLLLAIIELRLLASAIRLQKLSSSFGRYIILQNERLITKTCNCSSP